MESWRERGFVPDSDEEGEGEYDSQDPKGLSKDDDGNVPAASDTVDGKVNEISVTGDTTRQGELHNGAHTLADSGSNLVDDDGDDGEHDEKHEDANEESNEGTKELLDKRENQAYHPVSPGLPPSGVNRSSTPPPPSPSSKKQKDIFEMPSSSPDVLQIHHDDDRYPVSRPDAGLPSLDEAPPQTQLLSDDGGSSPLSSPPSFFGSLPSSKNNREQAVERPDDSENSLEKLLLPPLDIPEDILQELDQPARRSLRERNPIQLHPYLLESAQYQRLMKARGVRPVHVTRRQTDNDIRHPHDSSQGQESANGEETPPSSSSESGFRFPPPSPSRAASEQQRSRQRSSALHARQGASRAPIHLPTHDYVRGVKRRKLSHPDDVNGPPHRQERLSSGPRVIASQTESVEMPVEGASTVWDIPPSPPRSGSTASTQTTHMSGFRFPRGFTPPVMTTPITEPTPNLNAVDEPRSLENWTGRGASQNPIDVDSPSSAGDSNPDLEEELNGPSEEASVRQLQRKIKGVLPASWLRLDLKQQEKRTDPNSRNRDAASSHRVENAKGVAKKITKPFTTATNATTGPLSSPRRRLTSTLRLFDYEDGNGEDRSDDDDDSADDALSRDDNSREELARLVGFEDSFHDQPLEDDDIPEDNRIDGMIPPVHRDRSIPSSRGERRGVKRQRKTQGAGTVGRGPWERSRLKRQSRITDAMYGGQRQKRSSPPKPPKLGVLDAPDVARRPRREQPQFLRIAARQARSRRDGGRRSPNRKFLRLSSRPDTEDANTSLHEWRRGTIPQAKLTGAARSRPRARQPLVDLSTNEQNPLQSRYPQNATSDGAGDPAPASPDLRNLAAGDALNQNASTPSHTSRLNAADKLPVRREQQGHNKWVIRRNLAISSLKRNDPRPAVPEIEATNSASLSSPSLFQKSLSMLNRNYRLSKGRPQRHQPNITLDRFLSDTVPPVPLPNVPVASIEGGSHELSTAAPKSRRLRKRPPNRLDLNAYLANDQPSLDILYPQGTEQEPLPSGHLPEDTRPPNRPGGLTSFQRTYTLDFNIVPLFAGTFFHESTFVGSGEFARSLETISRDLDKDAGHSTVQAGDRSLRWGAWNDTVSSELGMMFETIAEDIERNSASPRDDAMSDRSNEKGCALYRSLVEYVIRNLFFIDPVDRAGFARRALSLVCSLNEHLYGFMSAAESNRGYVVRIACYNLVFANQAYQIACHDLVDPAVAEEVSELVKAASKQLISFVVSEAGMKEIGQFLEDSKHRERREAGIRDDHVSVEAYIVARHVLHSTDKFRSCFEMFVADALSSDAGALTGSKDVSHLEDVWHSVFRTLPLNEIDRFGITRIGSRFREANDNWSMVKRLLHPILGDYAANSSARPIPFNNYCRVLFCRCFYLINAWGWRDCKPILDTLFDFFARNTLYNLSHEETFGSPSFLEELDRDPALDVRPGESCFHIFLKIVGSGLRFMSKIYDKKKIRNFAWRLLPNHGRVYPKEKPLRQEDLDALRNHHDLLCTLYWSIPEGCRPRIEAIRDLVHPASSHRETCNISLRSWARLVRFKLSTDEDTSGLDPFADWHSYFVTELLKQHSLARTEIESQSNKDSRFSRQMIESTISQNQRQIETLLNTALGGLKSAVQLAPSLEHARMLISKMPIKAVLGLFNPKVARVNTVVSEALQVVVAYVQKDDTSAPLTSTVPVSMDEDSQEYGDWSDIEAIYGQEPSPPCLGIEHVEKVLRPAVARLVSNCFGEDQCPEDAILLNVVNCWTSIAQVLVKHGLRHWDNYVSHYDSESWATLRATVQTRKFTPRFLANCIDKDVRFLSECKAQVLGIWMTALVERSSMLKFQHVLTEALLNQDSENPLLKNLPFSRHRKSGQFSITLEDFSQRRLSLISSVLSNMREHLLDIEDTGVSREFLDIKQEYKEFIERLMASMKANYQELGNGAAESAHGAYVDFVQCVVGFLQQYTRDISPIDSFFTDPTTFPLPSTDPTYIVARLKSYEPKLTAEKVAKTLIVFVQGVSERAAIDSQQMYLVDQLCASMMDTYESGNMSRPTLRGVLLQCIFPAYLEIAFSSPAAWILSRPILQTISLTFKDLLFNMDTTDPYCVQSVVDIFHSVFQSSYQALRFVADDPDLLREPSVLLISSSFIETITSALPVIDYIDRVTEGTSEAIISQIQAFRQFALFAISRLRDGSGSGEGFELENSSLNDFSNAFFNSRVPGNNEATSTTSGFFEEVRHLATRELQSYVHESWSRHQGKYYFTRRGVNRPQEVIIDPSLAARLENSPGKVLEESVGVFLNVVHDLGLIQDEFD